jgi:hypothetical protein
VLTQTPPGSFVENRVEAVATLAIQLAQNRYVGQLRTVSVFELEAMIDRILDHYSKWSNGEEHELAVCVDSLETICFALSVPIAEAAYALYVLRDGIVSSVQDGSQDEKTETIRQVDRFFDALVRDLLRRY